MIFMDEVAGRQAYAVSEENFCCLEDALLMGSKKTNLRVQLLNFCQVLKTHRVYVKPTVGGGGHVNNMISDMSVTIENDEYMRVTRPLVDKAKENCPKNVSCKSSWFCSCSRVYRYSLRQNMLNRGKNVMPSLLFLVLSDRMLVMGMPARERARLHDEDLYCVIVLKQNYVWMFPKDLLRALLLPLPLSLIIFSRWMMTFLYGRLILIFRSS